MNNDKFEFEFCIFEIDEFEFWSFENDECEFEFDVPKVFEFPQPSGFVIKLPVAAESSLLHSLKLFMGKLYQLPMH